MAEPTDIRVGSAVWYGVERPRRVQVIGAPYKDGNRWRVPVRFRTGEVDDVMLTLVRVHKKRPSARRGREVPLNALENVVDEFNEVVPEDKQVGADVLKRLGFGR